MANLNTQEEKNTYAQQLKEMIAEEEGRVNALYTEIGKAYYVFYGDAPAPELAETVAAAGQSHKLIKGYTKELGLLRGVVACEKCGKEVSIHAAFCNSCGASMSSALRDLAGENDVICPACGLATPKDSVYCTKCGAKMASEPAPKAKIERVCPDCQTKVEEGDLFCPGCGNKMPTA